MKIHNSKISYDDYINHQKEKTENPINRNRWINEEWSFKISIFTELFNQNLNIIKLCKRGLCICARMGHEVVALQNIGLPSIGLDLVPFLPYVEQGDMHSLPYDDNTFDFVFSNSFDHSLLPQKFISEIERVLVPNGYCFLILQIQNSGDKYAENEVESAEEVINLFQKSNLIINESFVLSTRWTYNRKLIMQKQ